MKKNLGWIYNKYYYDFKSLEKSITDAKKENSNKESSERKSDHDIEVETEKLFFKKRNDMLYDTKFESVDVFFMVQKALSVELVTTYPGLLTGSGMSHETGKLGELKLGFSFDYTTGLPYITGSTVKGAIRHVFPFHLQLAASKVRVRKEKEAILEKSYALERYCLDYLFIDESVGVKITISKKQLLQLEWNIFEGKKITNIDEVVGGDGVVDFEKIKSIPIPVYETDIFHDAFISHSNNDMKVFLGNDFITPHGNNLQNPIPIQFLKVLPNVSFKFQFDVKPSQVDQEIKFSPDDKLKLFTQILLDFGVGAKTNVGYGQFNKNQK